VSSDSDEQPAPAAGGTGAGAGAGAGAEEELLLAGRVLHLAAPFPEGSTLEQLEKVRPYALVDLVLCGWPGMCPRLRLLL